MLCVDIPSIGTNLRESCGDLKPKEIDKNRDIAASTFDARVDGFHWNTLPKEEEGRRGCNYRNLNVSGHLYTKNTPVALRP